MSESTYKREKALKAALALAISILKEGGDYEDFEQAVVTLAMQKKNGGCQCAC